MSSFTPDPDFSLSSTSEHEAKLIAQGLDDVQRANATKALVQACRLAVEGTGEDQKCHGFCFVAGDTELLMATETGEDNEEVGIVGAIGKGEYDYRRYSHSLDTFDRIQGLATQDGAIVFDLRSGKLVGGNYRIHNVGRGETKKGLRHQAASAVARQGGGCFVVKASEDACGPRVHKGPPRTVSNVPNASIDVFYGCKESVKVPVGMFAGAEEVRPRIGSSRARGSHMGMNE